MIDEAARIGDEELEGGEAAAVGRARHGEGGVGERRPRRRRQARARRDLYQLLVAALETAFALAERDDMAGSVADHLHFDVAGVGHQRFDIDRVVAERRLGFGAAAFVGRFQFRGRRRDANAASAAARDRLHHDGAAREQTAGLVQRASRLRHRHAASQRQVPRRELVAEQVERRWRRADEGQSRRGAGAGEGGALAEEAVTRMHRVAAFGARDCDELRRVEIGPRARAAERHRPVGAADMKRGRVVLGKDRDGADAELRRGAGDADRDLAAIGDQQGRNGHVLASPPRCSSIPAGTAPI